MQRTPRYGSKAVKNIEGHDNMSNDVTAVIIRKTDQNQHGALYLMVRVGLWRRQGDCRFAARL